METGAQAKLPVIPGPAAKNHPSDEDLSPGTPGNTGTVDATEAMDMDQPEVCTVAMHAENCVLLMRALAQAAHAVAPNDPDNGTARMICWIMCADEELKRERKAATSGATER